MCDSLESFKNQLHIQQSCAPCSYPTADRCLNICYAQLHSPLNDHLYSLIHVVEQSDCACGHIKVNQSLVDHSKSKFSI